jgi:hypothetical protein
MGRSGVLARYDVRDRIRQSEKAAGNGGAKPQKGNAPQASQLCVCVLNTDARLWRRLGYAFSAAQGTGVSRPGASATGRSQRPAAVERAGPFRPEEHVLPESHGP